MLLGRLKLQLRRARARPTKQQGIARKDKENRGPEVIRCVECGGNYDSSDSECEEWLGCDSCDNWLHLLCTSLDPFLSSSDLKDIEFHCKDCSI